MLGGRVDAAKNPTTQSQRPFPSASISLTPISLSASESLAISALASTSSGSIAPALMPGQDAANASRAPCLATSRNFDGHELVADVLDDVTFKDGIRVTEDDTNDPETTDEKVAA